MTSSVPTKLRICVGLGTMGSRLAYHFAKAGHQVTFFSRQPEKAQDTVKQLRVKTGNNDIEIAEPTAAVERSDLIFLSIPFPFVKNFISDVEYAIKGKNKMLIDMSNAGYLGDLSFKSGVEYHKALLNDEKTQWGVAFKRTGFLQLGESAKNIMVEYAGDKEVREKLALLLSSIGFQGKDCGDLSNACNLEFRIPKYVAAFVHKVGPRLGNLNTMILMFLLFIMFIIFCLWMLVRVKRMIF
eukprot:TRINITY_DN8772_c0_g1_i1.p1 TRINITY_DN8772_c0_g1~~TRINITY_DN8772_c0_g1_i1.p1  ORF type:complete len:241 (+),score=57.79 TRINITY_DN8772_c0_g1_i1:36-758(+)